MELLPVVCLCLLTRCGITSADANGPADKTVQEGSDVILPCSLSTKENIESYLFDWTKAAQKGGKKKEVFFYDGGIHYNNGRPGQSEEFKGRVSHFPEELKHGNASIIIRNTKVTDSGDYTCVFPHLQPRQTFHIKLVVGAAPKPVVMTHKTKNGVLLQCEVQGSPQPTVEWKDSAGSTLPAGETQVSERDGRSYFTVNTTVTRSDDFRCVATQKEINHTIYTKIYVPPSVERGNPGSGANSSESTGWTVSGVLGGLLFFVIVGGVVLAVLIYMGCIPLNCKKGSPADHKEGSVVPLKSQPSRSQEAPDPET